MAINYYPRVQTRRGRRFTASRVPYGVGYPIAMMPDVKKKPKGQDRRVNGHRLNYIRTCRKRSGLTQKEVGFLLACEDGNMVYRYERGKQAPSLRSALACQIIFGVPIHELLTGINEEVEQITHNRAQLLFRRLQECQPDGMTQRKLAVINAIISRKHNAPHQNL